MDGKSRVVGYGVEGLLGRNRPRNASPGPVFGRLEGWAVSAAVVSAAVVSAAVVSAAVVPAAVVPAAVVPAAVVSAAVVSARIDWGWSVFVGFRAS